MRWTKLRAIGWAAALAAAAGGCGGGSVARSGAELFAGQCQVCHSLNGNESAHKVGGDLVGYDMTRAQLTSFTREMPTRRHLTPAELRAVVDYVYRAEQAAR